MKIFTKHQNVIFYAVAIAALSVGLYLWVGQGKDTNQDVNEGVSVINEIKTAVDRLEKDHDGQDALAVCLGKLIIASQDRTVTDVEFETCVITTAVPSRQTDEDRAPSDQTNTSVQPSDSRSSESSSSANNTPNNTPVLPENPQTPEPDNDGVIVDLPLLPEIHIPSPL